MFAIQAGGQYGGGAAGIQQVYIADPTLRPDTEPGPVGFAIPVSTVSPSFPVGSLPLAVLILDAVGRIQQIIDVRPSYLSSAPNLGSGMTEAIADPTKRVYFQNNFYVPRTFSLTPQIPFDLALPASGFFLGAGAVVVSGNNIATPAKYYSTATNGAADGWGLLAVSAINQGYVDPTSGAVTIRQVQTSGTFPANSLALFECTTDYVGLIRSLVDFRPSYI